MLKLRSFLVGTFIFFLFLLSVLLCSLCFVLCFVFAFFPSALFCVYEIFFLYFLRWHEQDENMKELVRGLVRDGRLEFMNGGWVRKERKKKKPKIRIE
jgi:hypothetical protein